MKKIIVLLALVLFIGFSTVHGASYWQEYNKDALEAEQPNLLVRSTNPPFFYAFAWEDIETTPVLTNRTRPMETNGETDFLIYIPTLPSGINQEDMFATGLCQTNPQDIFQVPAITTLTRLGPNSNWFQLSMDYMGEPTPCSFFITFPTNEVIGALNPYLSDNLYIAPLAAGLAALDTLNFPFSSTITTSNIPFFHDQPRFHYSNVLFQGRFIPRPIFGSDEEPLILLGIDPVTNQRFELSRRTIRTSNTSFANVVYNFDRIIQEQAVVLDNFPYELVYGQTVIHRGWVSLPVNPGRPDLAVNKVADRNANFHRSCCVDEIARGAHFLLHFQIPETGPGQDGFVIHIVNESTQQIALRIRTPELFTYLGGSSEPYRNTFIPIVTFNGSRSGDRLFNYNLALAIFQESDFPFATRADSRTHNDLTYGVFTYQLRTLPGLAPSRETPSVFLITQSNQPELVLNPPNRNIQPESRTLFNLTRNTREIYDFYDEFFIFDAQLGETFSFPSTFRNVQPLSWQGAAVNSNVTFTMNSSRDLLYYFEPGDSFPITRTSSYTVGDTDRLLSAIEVGLYRTGLDNTAGNLLIFFVVVLIVNILLMLGGFPFIALIIINSAILGAFTSFGFLPIWFLIPVFGLLGVGLFSLVQQEV